VDWEKAKEADILDKVIRDFDSAVMTRAPHEEKWVRWYKLYRSYTEKKDTGANLFIPYTFSAIESVVPRLISTMFASRPFIGVLPVNEESVDKAKMHEKLLDYQLTQRINTIELASMWIKEALMYGTSHIKPVWRYEIRNVKQKVPVTSILGVSMESKYQDTEIVAYDDPHVEHIDIWDIYVDPDATNVDDAEYVVHRVFRTKEHIKRMAQNGIYKNIEKIGNSFSPTSSDEIGSEERMSSIGLSKSPKQQDKIELLEYWTDERIIVVANRSAIIRNEPNPFWHGKKPFIRIVDHPVPHEYYGIGEIEPIEYLQYELNDTRNQRMDNVNLVLNRMWKVLRGSDIIPEQLISRPGGFIEVDDMGDIEEIKFTDVTSSSYKEEEEIKRDIDRTVGVFDYARGETTDRRETATTASILSNAANERFKLKVQLMEDMGLRRLGLMLIQLNQQFIDSERVIRVVGDDGVNFEILSPEDIIGEFDIMPIGSTVEPIINKETRVNQLISLYGVMKDSPHINQSEFLKKILETADIKDTSRIIIPMEQAIQRQMQQGMGAAPQPGGDIPQVGGIPNGGGELVGQ
jgi:hypothetical protein